VHIDHGSLSLDTESDVEQKVITPLLTGDVYLGIPTGNLATKKHLAPVALDKSAGKVSGYYPDYLVWMRGFPVLVVEAKAPDVPAETGYREASLYARHLNQQYPPNLNPCRFVLATNGKKILAGYWDSQPALECPVANLQVGSADLERLQEHWNARSLDLHAASCLSEVRGKHSFYPYDFAGGQPLLNARCPVNSFAADLSPILNRYFSSSHDEYSREIIERAYVCSAEVTEYDRVLEALLKERLAVQRDTIVQSLEPDRHREEHVARAISEFNRLRPETGQLQIVQGAVGSGKSLFVRRYKELLQPEREASRTRWAFVDFNYAPPDLSNAVKWLCNTFVESFMQENPSLDISSGAVLRGIFSRNIQMRKAIYTDLERSSPEQGAITRASDLARWQDDPEEMVRGIANYILGIRQEVLIGVMDNVDRLDLKSQLHAFQLALWFMRRTHCFVILQMRDETYERYKNQPPLDTFRTAVTFHISPPRFIDVVKKRLELSLEYLATEAQEKQTYMIESGARITYPKSELGRFLRDLYVELFDRKRNISRVLEAVAGRDVRRALEMFVSIITSGHLSEAAVTSTVLGAGAVPITERNIIKILMRTGYLFFSDHSGFLSNIFGFDPEWQKPDNFLLIEILFFLARNRRRKGAIGLEGYFACRHIADELQQLGYIAEDVLAASNILLHRQLIAADHMNYANVTFDDSVRVLASGFMHVRILSGRIEYLYGVIPTTPLLDRHTAQQLGDFVKNESIRGRLGSHQRVRAVEIFYKYLSEQRNANSTPFSKSEDTGAAYVLAHIAEGIEHFHNVHASSSGGVDLLDF
jgi:hypothetical protein